jgi:hypothetical protein
MQHFISDDGEGSAVLDFWAISRTLWQTWRA